MAAEKGNPFYGIPSASPRRSHKALQHAWAGSGRHPAGPGGRDPAGHRDRHRPRHQLLRPLRRRSQDLRALRPGHPRPPGADLLPAASGRRLQRKRRIRLVPGAERDPADLRLGAGNAGHRLCRLRLPPLRRRSGRHRRAGEKRNSGVCPVHALARPGDALAASHYGKLSVNASACISCGHCAARCPFGVDQPSRMEEIARYFA